MALYQLIHTGAPAHAVVDNAVRATERLRRTSARGRVNAVLRQFLRRRDALLEMVALDPEGRFSYPRWWIERIAEQYPGRGEAILDAGNARPPLCLRVNAKRGSRDRYLAELARQGIAASPVGAAGVVVEKQRPVTDLPG